VKKSAKYMLKYFKIMLYKISNIRIMALITIGKARAYYAKKNTLKEESVTIERDQGLIKVSILVPVIFSLPESKANLKFLYVFLRLLTTLTGKTLLTFESIAFLMGFKDRRNINNFYREFNEAKGDILAFLSRKLLYSDLIPLIQEQILSNIMLPLSAHYKLFIEKTKSKISYVTFLHYVQEVSVVNILKETKKWFDKKSGDLDYSRFLDLLIDNKTKPVILEDILHKAQTADQEKFPKRLNLKRKELCILVNFLIGAGLNQNIIAMLLNVSKSTVSNLMHELSDLNLMIIKSIDKWSGKIGIDEKYFKINGIPHYVISIVDFITGIPLYMNVYKDVTAESFTECFLMFKHFYGIPRLIVSDGSKSLKAAREKVFPKVHYQLCKFHKLRNLFKLITKTYKSKRKQCKLKNLAKKTFQCKSVSSRKKSFKRLKGKVSENVSLYIDNNILAFWRQLSKNYTSNVSERFNRKIEKVLSGRYGITSIDTARRLIYSLWLKDVIVRGKLNIDQNSFIARLSISRICQSFMDVNKIEALFKDTMKTKAS